MYRTIICAFLFSVATGEIIRESPCDFSSISTVINLNITALAGEWTQLKRIPNTLEKGSCSTLTVTVHNDASATHIMLQNREVYERKAYIETGEIVPNLTTPGRFLMNYQNVSFDSVVVAIDYSKYFIIYSCRQISVNESSVVAWVYSRGQSLQKVEEDIIYTAAINSLVDLRNATWIESKHTTEACQINGSIIFRLSPILAVLAMLAIGKDLIFAY